MLNKVFIICSSVFLAVSFISPGFADEHFPFLAEVSKESVNVRAGPNTNFEKIDKLNKGVHVVVLGRTYEWYKIQPLSTTKTYIRSDYLTIAKGDKSAFVIGDNVNVRSQANSQSASLGELKKGVSVQILGQENGWCSIGPVKGVFAWIHQDFLKEISEDVPQEIPTTAVKTSPSELNPWVSMRGKVEALVQSPQKDIHYEIVMDDKSVFYLQDMPRIEFFCNTVVDVEGLIVPDPEKKFMHPILHISRVSLVL